MTKETLEHDQSDLLWDCRTEISQNFCTFVLFICYLCRNFSNIRI